MNRILVIKLSALGDMVQAMPAFARIRTAHAEAQITLLTTPLYEALARATPYFDAVETDGRPDDLIGWLNLVRRLRKSRFDRVYDLQANDRTHLYFQALRPSPPLWSGTAWGCSLRHTDPERMRMHTLERHAQQLEIAGIWPNAPKAPGSAPPPDLGFLGARALDPLLQPSPTSRLDARATKVMIVPGASARRPEKLWPVQRYAELARRLRDRGIQVDVIGGRSERALAQVITSAAPGARDLTGQTDFSTLAALATSTALAVGNDTGPMHLLAAAGASCLVLFSATSDPALCAPRGKVRVLQSCHLSDLSVDEVWTETLTCLGLRS